MFLEGLIISLPSNQTNSITNEFGCIMLENNIETSNITIKPINKFCYMDINHYFSNNILYIIVIIQKHNKKTQNTYTTTTTTTTTTSQKYTIHYGNGNSNIELSNMKYNLYIMNKSNASINKKNKKQCLKLLDTLPNMYNTNSLFILDSKIFFNIDNNGDIVYYPDSIEKYIINSEAKTIYNSNLSSTTITNYFNEEDTTINTLTDLKTLLNKHEYTEISTSNISITNSYVLNELPLSINLSNNSNEYCQVSNVTCSNGSNVLFGISNILNWFNPWSYYTSNTISNSLQTTQTPQNIQYTVKDYNISVLEDEPIKYYICNKNMNIIKVTSNSVKVLKPKLLDIPIQIENMKIDELENVIIEGKNAEINKKISIHFNKFMLNQTKQIVS
jgi:hypothetical protein